MQRRALKYLKFGDPREVTELVTETISSDIGPSEASARWLASPVNPLDINKIQGAYMLKPPLPAIGGSEGVGRVVKVGPSVTTVSPGDKVTTFTINSPCWTDYSIVEESDLTKIDQRITPLQGAIMMINPTTAWLMIKMGGMEEGDWIV
ncbi:hypothetical protein PFISCL1PPCAC_13006 [Pristionchus fissidentatus]|uniref:Enoyl-[acyl-carrier-protein] reductase, mitochondrial n=1 Tax=Pristionchus fissidentatus TaxID=1538716 RepID=A0AAV5VQA7_9BILA|nr:hypothetical protein PFISCL1PPCAC_13006 [Pristionchus fissidentatus]